MIQAILAIAESAMQLVKAGDASLRELTHKRPAINALLAPVGAWSLIGCATGDLDVHDLTLRGVADVPSAFAPTDVASTTPGANSSDWPAEESYLASVPHEDHRRSRVLHRITEEALSRPSDAGSVSNDSAVQKSEQEVEAQRTPLSGKEAAKRLERAYRVLIGKQPTRETLELLAAHWAHETNQGASMFNYNFGGIKGVGPDGSYVLNRTREGSGTRVRQSNHRFRAYANATEGAVDYISLLQRLYGRALLAAESGDVEGFVDGLKEGGYFSGDKQTYLQKVVRFMGFARAWGFDALGPAGISPLYRPGPRALGGTKPLEAESGARASSSLQRSAALADAPTAQNTPLDPKIASARAVANDS